MVDNLGYQWGYIFILFCPLVQWSIILYWAEFAIFLFDEEEIGCIGRLRDTDRSSTQMFFYKFVDFGFFLKIQR